MKKLSEELELKFKYQLRDSLNNFWSSDNFDATKYSIRCQLIYDLQFHLLQQLQDPLLDAYGDLYPNNIDD